MQAPGARPYAALQRALIALLAFDCAVYALLGTGREAADSIAWLTLLSLFYIETSARQPVFGALAGAGIRYTRLAAAVVVAAAGWAHVEAAAWLDAANSGLWIAVVVLLELQVRYPAYAARQNVPFTAVAVLLYGALCVLPVAWLVQREWLAAYDAALWLAAFATIEMDVRPGSTVTRTLRETPR